MMGDKIARSNHVSIEYKSLMLFHSQNKRPSVEADPTPVPRTLEWNHMGAEPYKMALKADWKKYSSVLKATFPV